VFAERWQPGAGLGYCNSWVVNYEDQEISREHDVIEKGGKR
jgi:hypothetical protein